MSVVKRAMRVLGLVALVVLFAGCDSFIKVRGRIKPLETAHPALEYRVVLQSAADGEVLGSQEALGEFELTRTYTGGKMLVTILCSDTEVFRSHVFSYRELPGARQAAAVLDLGVITVPRCHGPQGESAPPPN